MKRRDRAGFTLIDLVVSMGILGMLTSVTMRAVNPSKQLLSATDAVRMNAARQLQNAFTQYLIANGGVIPTTQKPIPTGEENAKQICKASKTSPGCVNLDALALAPSYIPSIPIDEVEPCANYIGYKIYREGNLVSIRPVNLGKKKSDNLVSDGLCGDGLVAQWSFESITGTCPFMTLGESAGVNNLHLDRSCGALSTDIPPVTLLYANTRSLQLNGTTSQYAERATFSGLDTAATPAFTIAGWIKLSNVSNNRAVIAHFPKTGSQNPCVPSFSHPLSSHYEVYVAVTTGQLRFYSGNIGDISSGVNVANGQWRHFAVTYDYNNGKTLKFYIDGSWVSTATAGGSGIIDADAGQVPNSIPPPATITCPWHLDIGGQPDLYSPANATDKMPFLGFIDEVQMYKKAIGLEMIKALAGQ